MNKMQKNLWNLCSKSESFQLSKQIAQCYSFYKEKPVAVRRIFRLPATEKRRRFKGESKHKKSCGIQREFFKQAENEQGNADFKHARRNLVFIFCVSADVRYSGGV